jgi:hypothetical protein
VVGNTVVGATGAAAAGQLGSNLFFFFWCVNVICIYIICIHYFIIGGVGGGKVTSTRNAGDKVDVDVGVFEERKGNADVIDANMDVCYLLSY